MHNPLAFPRPASVEHHAEPGAQDGMSLRDYFAAKALQGLLAFPKDLPPKFDASKILSKLAYEYADGMLKARQAK